jgi:prepilin-type N-terminal cleavage/methylation domain-containing protein
MSRERGFSLVEVLVSLAIMVVVGGAFLQVAAGGQQLARSQSEGTDLHQRIRVAVDRLRSDIALAGTGPLRGDFGPGLGAYLAPVLPARLGARRADPALTATIDRLTVVYVPEGVWPATLSAPMASAVAPLVIDATEPGCPAAGVCGFTVGSRALVVDTSGTAAGHEFFTVTGTAGGLFHDGANPPFTRAFGAGAFVVPVVQRTYQFDQAERRLVVYDGYQSEMPLIDNVVDARFSYFIDGAASSVPRPPDGAANCVYAAGAPPVPRLDDLGSGVAAIAPAALADGPICGAGASAFDGDLFRIRRVRVVLRLQAASDELRGSGAFFARPGRSSNGYSDVPDFEVTFDVSPRSMGPMVLSR